MYAIGPGRYNALSAIKSSKTVGFTCRSASRIPDDSNWKTRVASREHRVGLLVVERDGADVEVAGEVTRLVDHVEVAQAEEVHLQQPERLDRRPVELRDDFLVGALLLERDHVHQRLGADDDR